MVDYRRDLDISEAMAQVCYQSGGTSYHRELFCNNRGPGTGRAIHCRQASRLHGLRQAD